MGSCDLLCGRGPRNSKVSALVERGEMRNFRSAEHTATGREAQGRQLQEDTCGCRLVQKLSEREPWGQHGWSAQARLPSSCVHGAGAVLVLTHCGHNSVETAELVP